jgi:hypothetical protein
MYEHLKPLRKKLLSLNIEEVPSPWQLVTTVAIGGLRSVGFDRASENLLVVSSQGRGVIDCLTGEKVARDYEEFYEDETSLEAQGIGILSDRLIRMSGLFGGGLPIITEDGWQLECLTLKWPSNSKFGFTLVPDFLPSTGLFRAISLSLELLENKPFPYTVMPTVDRREYDWNDTH